MNVPDHLNCHTRFVSKTVLRNKCSRCFYFLLFIAYQSLLVKTSFATNVQDFF
jgi:hypothetical protein